MPLLNVSGLRLFANVSLCSLVWFTPRSGAQQTSSTLQQGTTGATRELSVHPTWQLTVPDVNVGPLNVTPQSRVAYANACSADIGVIPSYSCLVGPNVSEILITKKGVKQTLPVADNSCDKPVKLGLSNEGQCVPFTRLVDLSPANNSNITIMAICRKYHASSGQNDPIFNDLAIIAHNRATGATCFFQSPVDSKLNGTQVPSPMSSSPTATQYWLEPNKVNGLVQYQAPASINCSSCHDSDPFILSPWIQQVAKLAKWDPKGKYDVDKFGTFSPVGGRPWVTAHISTGPPLNQNVKCTPCHRIGGSTINVISAGPGGLHAENGFPDFHGFMPPGNSDSAFWWPYLYNEAVFELTNCVDPAGGIPAATCNAVRAGTLK